MTLQQMCEGKFELAELHGKLANVVDDLPGASLKAVGNFKWVTGNAPIMVQRKHKDPFTYWPTTKMVFGCNKLPKPSEDTIAYFRRFNIIPFTRLFIGKADDKSKLNKISTPTELSGLLNLALAGLKRLLKNGDYTNCKSIEENRQLYIRSSDSCKAFAEEQLEESESPKDYISTETVYQSYVTYCHENRLPKIEAKKQLTAAIQQTYPNVKHTQERIVGKVTWVWQYLKVKSVTTVTTVTANHILENFNVQNSYNRETPVTTVTPVTTSAKLAEVPLILPAPTEQTEHTQNSGVNSLHLEPEQERVYGDCANWHKPGCSMPNAEPTCVTRLNKYAADCQHFIDRHALVAGAVSVLNDTSKEDSQ